MKRKVLFIDDDKDFLDGFTEKLKMYMRSNFHDLSFDSATSAKEAIIKIDRQDFNIVIVDYMMPGIDGLKLLEILGEKSPDIVPIILTGYASEKVIAELKSKNIYYLQKPCKIENLLKTIDLALEKS